MDSTTDLNSITELISKQHLQEAVEQAAKEHYYHFIRTTNSTESWESLSDKQQLAYKQSSQIQIERALNFLLPIIKVPIIKDNFKDQWTSYQASYFLAKAVGQAYQFPEWLNPTSCSIEEYDTAVGASLEKDMEERNSQIEVYQEIMPEVSQQILEIREQDPED
jgi:hypothetical protein